VSKGLGSFLQEANKELYDAKVEPIEFSELEKNGFKVEWAWRGKELIVHVYRAKNVKWSLDYAKRLYALMDEHAPGEEREVGYEDMVDSWYIKSPDYASGKLNPRIPARKLCETILEDIS
jgi:hypothetical protein